MGNDTLCLILWADPISETPGGLNREGGLLERGGGLFTKSNDTDKYAISSILLPPYFAGSRYNCSSQLHKFGSFYLNNIKVNMQTCSVKEMEDLCSILGFNISGKRNRKGVIHSFGSEGAY